MADMVPETGTQWTYNDHVTHPDPPHQPLYLASMLRVLADSGVKTILDAGCGDGNFAESLSRSGYQVFGLEMSSSGVSRARSREIGRFEQGSIYGSLIAPFERLEPFDAIVSIEVIEHLYAPRAFMRAAWKALPAEGLLILTTPYWGYLKNLALATTNRMDRALTPLWDGGHIKHWSRKTLTQLGQESGFTFVDFYGAGRRYAPGLWNGMMITFRKNQLTN